MMNQFGKLFVSGISLMTICTMSAAQSSVGIGTNNPNPKSVLHLEAPAGNQGLLLPRLTTAQMQANPFFNSLGIADKGLTVYDTDRNQMFSWDGTGWKSSAKFSLPYVDSLENAPAGTNLMR
ncbi:MAG: hypothetical protein MUE71_07255, partial [Chitinophagaceae bacterium]|nr:hypothetical protein [Chitinophagaceae bacterium]